MSMYVLLAITTLNWRKRARERLGRRRERER
jgi:hypothetical protein